ncbi:MAG: hypothetical protein ISS31_01675 [Kiritimatiellae bacterium]|nr:hypothetical protein [Kiritimatiellia bacterium]
MKRSYICFLAICFITLSGSCRLDAAQPAAKPVPGKEQKAAKPKPDPRLRHIPVEHHEYVKTLEKEQARMMSPWFKAQDLYHQAHEYATVFGLRVRRSARKKVPSLIAKAKKEEEKFRKAYDRFRKPLEKKEGELKDRAMKLSEKEGALDDPLVNKRLDELYDEAFVYGQKLNALSALQKVFHHSVKMPDELSLLGISSHDSTASQVARDNPKLVEARFIIKDCEADMALLEKLKAEIAANPTKRWSSSNEAHVKRAKLTLEKAVTVLEREVEKAKTPFLREAEKLKKKVESTQKKIEELEKRKRKTVNYYQRLSEYDGDMQRHLKAAALIDKLAIWKKPEKKKAPAKKPAPKKGGH